MPSSCPPRFRARTGPPLVWRTWPDQSALFDPASGDTHVLDAVAREAMACLAEQAHDAAGLTAAMARRLDVPADDALHAYVGRVLAQLDELGLIEAVGS